jgi:hypothetical protein
MDIDVGPLGSIACRSASPDSDVDLVVTAHMEAIVQGTEDDGGCVSFCKKMFRDVLDPVLPTPTSHPRRASRPSTKAAGG